MTTTEPDAAPAAEDDTEHELRVRLTVTEEVTYDFTATLILDAADAAHAVTLTDRELAAWLEENDEHWIDHLDPTGGTCSLDINERSVDEAELLGPEDAPETGH